MLAAWSSREVFPTPGSPERQERFPCSLVDPADEQAQLLDLRLAADQVHWPGGRLIAACADPVHLPTFTCRPGHVQGRQGDRAAERVAPQGTWEVLVRPVPGSGWSRGP